VGKKAGLQYNKCKYKQRGLCYRPSQAERDKSAVSVYNKQGVFLFTKILGETYAISSEVSPSGREVLINCVDISGVSINTGLHLYTISGGNVAGKTFENVIFPSIRYLNDDTIVAVSDSAIYLLDKILKKSGAGQ